MLIAHVDGERRLAEKFAHKIHTCECPGCAAPVLARVGEQRVAHWAHVRKTICPVAAGETPWHREWKSLGCPEEIEVVRPEWPANRADLCLVEAEQLQVVELQHSGITLAAIQQRELAYRDVVWIVDVRKRNFAVAHDHFQWKRASAAWAAAEQVIFDDGKVVHGRLAGACVLPIREGHLLFPFQNTSGPVLSMTRPATRAALLTMLVVFKVARGEYLAAREAERLARKLRAQHEQELRSAAERDTWFKPSPCPPKRRLTENEQVREDLRRVSAALDAMRAENAPKPRPSAQDLDYEVIYGEWPTRDRSDKSRS